MRAVLPGVRLRGRGERGDRRERPEAEPVKLRALQDMRHQVPV